jgi:hypothetical protein
MIGADGATYVLDAESDDASKYQRNASEQTGMAAESFPGDDKSDIASMTWSEGLREIDEAFPEPSWNNDVQDEQMVDQGLSPGESQVFNSQAFLKFSRSWP